MNVYLAASALPMNERCGGQPSVYLRLLPVHLPFRTSVKANILAEWEDEKPARHAEHCETCLESAPCERGSCSSLDHGLR